MRTADDGINCLRRRRAGDPEALGWCDGADFQRDSPSNQSQIVILQG
jgi:hypothetical protein